MNIEAAVKAFAVMAIVISIIFGVGITLDRWPQMLLVYIFGIMFVVPYYLLYDHFSRKKT